MSLSGRPAVTLGWLAWETRMVELTKTTNPVRLSFLQAVLADAGIESFVADEGAASLWGSAIPVRLMVDEMDLPRARRVIAEAEPS